MIFSELYSAYYNAVADIIKKAVDHPLKKDELRQIIEEHAFGESVLNIEPALASQKWQLLNINDDTKVMTTPVKHVPTMPITTLQKRWLKSVFEDPRIKLFTDEIIDFPDVEPLFRQEDIIVFDKYSDGDPYDDPGYIKRFRLITDAIKNNYPLRFDIQNGSGEKRYLIMLPAKLEYSEKDDKFRLAGRGVKSGSRINLARIISCKPYNKEFELTDNADEVQESGQVEFELTDQRNALERIMLHFAHFEKEVEKLDTARYRVKVFYDRNDETEMVIRILSFGPMIKVVSPQHFSNLIKTRLIMQKSCGL